MIGKWYRRFLVAMLCLSPLYATSTFADIYKFIDDDGVTHLTNIPTESNRNYILLIKEKRVIMKVKGDVAQYDDIIRKASEKYDVDYALIKAVIKAESNFNHRAVSPVGAQGLMQLMPKTASSLNVQDSFHPENNINGGVRYLRYLLRLFNGNLSLALAAYNAGEGAVARYNNRIPPYPETQTYVQRVLQYLEQYRSLSRN
ncbi:MAG: transglycosylase SLT domain-containing protein [Syntrophales bacterium]|jgi:soluble lytic murein transglycosylase-like protein|nr:transglycosylase SLT domain-containing protein [Syntrophales bacterium]